MDFKSNVYFILSGDFISDQYAINETEPYYYYLQIAKKSLISLARLYIKDSTMFGHLFSIFFAILPKGTVKDESTFFILVSILVGLVVAAFLMRFRRNRQSE